MEIFILKSLWNCTCLQWPCILHGMQALSKLPYRLLMASVSHLCHTEQDRIHTEQNPGCCWVSWKDDNIWERTKPPSSPSSSHVQQWPGEKLHAGPSCTISTGVLPADVFLGEPGRAARAVLLLESWGTVTARKRGKEKTKCEMAIFLWGMAVILCDCRMCVLTHFLFQRTICDVGESRNVTFSENGHGSE